MTANVTIGYLEITGESTVVIKLVGFKCNCMAVKFTLYVSWYILIT